MPVTPSSLTSDALLAQAQGAARTDEQRLGVGIRQGPPSLRSEETLRGWGDAALLRLEWNSHCSYPPAQHREYGRAYVEEFHRARAIRTAQWVASHRGATAG